MNSPSPTSLRRRASRAFSLLEMLVVLVIIGIITSFTVPALKTIGRGSSLNSAGNLVANLAALARQTAMSKNTMAALVMLGRQNTLDDYRAFAVLEYVPDLGWVQAGQWETLPTGIICDFNSETDSSFLENASLQTGLACKLPILYQGREIDLTNRDGYAARIFTPIGALRNAELPAQVRLVEGVMQGNLLNYTHRAPGGALANFYDIAIVGATGATKISRP